MKRMPKQVVDDYEDLSEAENDRRGVSDEPSDRLPEPISVREAGRKGGERTSEKYGPQFYEEIGRLGAKRVQELVRRGKRAEDNAEAGAPVAHPKSDRTDRRHQSG